jgi:hypothetical protein
MQLINILNKAINQVDFIVKFYEALLTRNQRPVRQEWKNRFFDAKLTTWAQRDGLWNSRGPNLIIVGNNMALLTHRDFASDSLSLFYCIQ